MRSLLGHAYKRLDLGRLEDALVERLIGRDLNDALSRLGHLPSKEASQRRTVRTRSAAARSALRAAVEPWPEPWAQEWAEAVIRAGLHGGLDVGDIEAAVHDVRRLLDWLDDRVAPSPRRAPHSGRSSDPGTSLDRGEFGGPSPDDRRDGTDPAGTGAPSLTSRTELAAALFGSSHALDQGTRLASFVRRALRCRLGEPLGDRELWEAAGIQADRVSAPALAWAVPATGNSPIDLAIRAATDGRLPLHLSLLAMLRHPLKVPAGAPILLVENPRLVEAAAERGLGYCVVATNGNPTIAVTTLVQQLRKSEARLWYHGDFDAAGVAICRRMHDLGCRPWRMDAEDYEEAVSRAERDGVRLDRDSKACGPTPWDSALEELFGARRLIIHEEFVLDGVLEDLPPSARSG